MIKILLMEKIGRIIFFNDENIVMKYEKWEVYMLKIECKAVSSKNALIIKLSGELDMHTIETVRQYIDKFLDKKVGKLFFDLRDIAFIDSSGIGLILGRYKKIQQLGGSLAIICNKPQIKKILEMSGITQIVKIYEDFKPEEEGI